MSNEALYRLLMEGWQAPAYQQAEQACKIAELAERIYQQTLAAMYPIRVYTTDNTKSSRKE